MVQIPESHRDLLERPIVVTLVTLMPDGQPQATPVWFDWDGEYVRVNSAKGRAKDRNMRERPRVTVLFVDHENPYRYMEIRGEVVEVTEEGALEHINALSSRYFGREDFFANMPERRNIEVRVMYKIKPTRIVAPGVE
jgi:PPOX class probable F420-dependent enzyme